MCNCNSTKSAKNIYIRVHNKILLSLDVIYSTVLFTHHISTYLNLTTKFHFLASLFQPYYIKICGSFANCKSRKKSSRSLRDFLTLLTLWVNEWRDTDEGSEPSIGSVIPPLSHYLGYNPMVEADEATTTIASLFRKVWQTTSLLTGHSSPDYLYVFCPRGHTRDWKLISAAGTAQIYTVGCVYGFREL